MEAEGRVLDEYIRASTFREVLNLLKRHGEKARIIGGGTLLYEFEFKGLLSNITTLIDLTGLRLDYVKRNSSGLRIGASTTFTGLLESEGINSRPAYGSLVDALRAVRPVQVRNVATVGGALSSGLATLDLPPTSLAMSARVKLLGTKGPRIVPVKDFFVGFLETATKRGEFLTELQIPSPPTNTGSSFLKLEMNSVDWAVLNVATKVTLRKGKVSDTRIVFGGGVGDVPARATEAEDILESKEPTEVVIRDAAEKASASTKFTDDDRASAEYRREISKVLLRDSLLISVERARKDSK